MPAWADFGRSFDPVQDWSDGTGLSMWLRFSEATEVDQEVSISLFSGDPEAVTPFEVWLEISPKSADPSGWILLELPWDRFARAEWADEGGLAELDPSQVVGIGLSFANPDDSQGESIVWVDDLRLLSEAPPPALTEVEPDDTPATATVAPVAGATATEAAMVTEPTPPPAPVAPAEEENESGGGCPISLGLILVGVVLVGRGTRKPK